MRLGDRWSCSSSGPGRIASSARTEATSGDRWALSSTPGVGGYPRPAPSLYAKVMRKRRDGFVCRADRSRIYRDRARPDAAGVMALGAQTATAASEGVIEYNTRLTLTLARALYLRPRVFRGQEECEVGRWVTLFKQRPGADRKIVAVRSRGPACGGAGTWGMRVPQGSLPVRMGGACMPRCRPRCAIGSCAAATARRSSRSCNPPSKPPGCRSSGDSRLGREANDPPRSGFTIRAWPSAMKSSASARAT